MTKVLNRPSQTFTDTQIHPKASQQLPEVSVRFSCVSLKKMDSKLIKDFEIKKDERMQLEKR